MLNSGEKKSRFARQNKLIFELSCCPKKNFWTKQKTITPLQVKWSVPKLRHFEKNFVPKITLYHDLSCCIVNNNFKHVLIAGVSLCTLVIHYKLSVNNVRFVIMISPHYFAVWFTPQINVKYLSKGLNPCMYSTFRGQKTSTITISFVDVIVNCFEWDESPWITLLSGFKSTWNRI